MSRNGRWIRIERRRAIYERDGHRCIYCGWGSRQSIKGPLAEGWYLFVKLTLDHVVPGGGNASSNLATACVGCNSTKKDMSVRAWLRYLTEREGAEYIPRVRKALRRVRRS